MTETKEKKDNKGICVSYDRLSITTNDLIQRFTINEIQQFRIINMIFIIKIPTQVALKIQFVLTILLEYTGFQPYLGRCQYQSDTNHALHGQRHKANTKVIRVILYMEKDTKSNK